MSIDLLLEKVPVLLGKVVELILGAIAVVGAAAAALVASAAAPCLRGESARAPPVWARGQGGQGLPARLSQAAVHRNSTQVSTSQSDITACTSRLSTCPTPHPTLMRSPTTDT